MINQDKSLLCIDQGTELVHLQQTEFVEIYKINPNADPSEKYRNGFIGRIHKNNINKVVFVMEENELWSNKEEDETNNKNTVY